MAEGQNRNFEIGAQIDRRIAEIDAIVGRQLDAILHHPDFKSLEANWRGLYYLTDQEVSRLRVKVKVLNLGKRELLKDFDRAFEISQSNIYKKVVSDIFPGGWNHPFGLLIGAYEFDHLPPDASIVEKMAEIAARAHAPFVAGAAPSMFDWSSFDEAEKTREPSVHCRSTPSDRWNAFRETPGARYVGLCLPHILLREPYRLAENFVFRESAEKTDRLWGSAAFAFAACVVRAHGEKGWLGRMRGPDGDGAINGTISSTGAENASKIRLDADLSRHLPALANLGLMALADDLAGPPYFFNSQSTNKPKIYEQEDATSFARLWAQLENVLAVSRFAVNIMSLWLDNYDRFPTEGEMKTHLLNWLWQYFQAEESASDEDRARRPLSEFNLTLEKVPEKPGDYRCILFIRPVYLLDDPQIALRAEIYLAKPGRFDD